MNREIITLDVRDDIRTGREPFSRIMRTVSALTADQDLVLRAPFEPIPLLDLMAQRGFEHRSSQTSSGDWEILLTRESKPEVRLISAEPDCPPARAAGVEVDARGLEPPQPLVAILEALASLPKGGELCARTDRRPLHLYPHLEERGFAATTAQDPDGSFITYIHSR